MAYKIYVTSDDLRDLSSELTKLQSDLFDITERLRDVELQNDNGGNIRVNCSYRFSDGSKFTGKYLRDAVNALARASHKLGMNCQEISGSILKVADLFEDTEKENTASILRLKSTPEKDLGFWSSGAFPFSNIFRSFDASLIVDAIGKLVETEIKEREVMRSEYEEILRTPDPASNPRTYEIIDERLKDCEFDQRHRQLVIDKIKEAPSDFRDLYLYSFYEYEIKDGASSGYSGIYKSAENAMYVDSSAFANDEDFIDCYFHETGHAIDGNAGQFTKNSDLLQKLQTDTENFINEKIDVYAEGLTDAQKDNILQAFMNGDAQETSFTSKGTPVGYPPDHLSSAEKKVYNKVVKACYTELQTTAYESDCMPWDIMTGMTNNTITSGGGHRKDYAGDYYWFDPNGNRTGLECAEAWAEYYSAMMTDDADSKETHREYFHDAAKYMSETAKNVAQEYRG